MTSKEADKFKKWFGEGVSARVWNYNDKGSWEIVVNRDARVSFLGLDDINRKIWHLRKCIECGRDDLELWSGSYSREDAISFDSPADAAPCVAEIGKAVAYIQSISDDDRWHPCPADLYSTFPSECDQPPDEAKLTFSVSLQSVGSDALEYGQSKDPLDGTAMTIEETTNRSNLFSTGIRSITSGALAQNQQPRCECHSCTQARVPSLRQMQSFVQHPPMLDPEAMNAEIAAKVQEAVLAERERCAKLADDWPTDLPVFTHNESLLIGRGCLFLAAKIREGK